MHPSGGSGRGGGGSDDRGGDDDGGGEGRGGDGRGGDDRGGRGSGDDDGSSGRGRGGGGEEDDDRSGKGAGRTDAEQRDRGRRDRPEAVVELGDDDLARVLRGERTLIDDRGRVLEVEIELEHGQRTVVVKPHGGAARRNPGPIGSVRAVDAGGVVTREVVIDRTGRAVQVRQDPNADRRTRAVVRSLEDDDLGQVGDDLSPDEEDALIKGGWR